MKGLLIKDLMLLTRQRATLVLVVFFAVFMFENGTFPLSGAIAYFVGFFTILAINSTSYDEFDNGYAFLFTLPVTIKTYVLEKYLYALLAAFCSAFVSVGYVFIRGNMSGGEGFIGFACGFTAMILLVVAVMLPLQFKFGMERSRMMMILVGGLVGGLGAFSVLSLGTNGRLQAVKGALRTVGQQLSGITWAILGVCFVILVYLASIMLSIRIMKKKDF
ncbi:MAG: ABC-2 transporter permease [Butyrivibrio sp.]|nr:ABC-2 transporter permease [Muribaculum sp.]MCM1551637.1 ABC-2 transporter permease [Butyrivibrio sp.]